MKPVATANNRGPRTRASRDALDGLPHEKFRRIIGLFDAVVPSGLKEKDSGGSYTNPIVQEFDKLRRTIESRLAQRDANFERDELGDYVHNLNLLLGELLPLLTLENAMPPIRDDYRARVSAEVYGGYVNSPTYKALDDCDGAMTPEQRLQFLRADYLQLINEIRKLTLLDFHIEETRSFLIRKLRWTVCKLVVIPLLVLLLFLACQIAVVDVSRSRQNESISTIPQVELNDSQASLAADLSRSVTVDSNGTPLSTQKPSPVSVLITRYLISDNNPNDRTTIYKILIALTLLSLSAIVGAVGSFISALLRIEAVPENPEIARNMVALRYSESTRLAPVTGFVFALLLSFVFGGRLLNGLLFPEVSSEYPTWFELLFAAPQLAKWLVWSFIVGFAERLMPDMIDRLVIKAGKSDQTAAPATVSGSKAAFHTNGTEPGVEPIPFKRRRQKRQNKRAAKSNAAQT